MYPQLGLRFRGNNKGFREIVATGGIITPATVSGGYKYHTFISNGTFTLEARSRVEYLLVGGGGGGGNNFRGGGAGNVITGEIFLEAGNYSVVIGNGGRGAGGRPHFRVDINPPPSGNGGSTVFASQTSNGGNGGSQGGASGGPGGGSGGGENGTGGAGTLASDWASATGTGSSGYYAGGGGGARSTGQRGYISGGLGGGGRGGFTLAENDNFGPSGGQARTGSGGGAGFQGGGDNFIMGGGGGASGIAIIRYVIYKV